MRKISTAVLFGFAIAASLSTAALADDGGHAMDHNKGGLGFRSSDAPIGMRWWLSDMVALDAGVGFTSEKLAGVGTDAVTGNPKDETFTSFSVDVGVPVRLMSWDNVHFLFRPGVTYTSADDIGYFFDSGTDAKEKRNDYSVTGELEVEYFMAKNASISAAHGFGFASSKLDVAGFDADTIFGTFGSNFTTLGFHVYLWAPAGQ